MYRNPCMCEADRLAAGRARGNLERVAELTALGYLRGTHPHVYRASAIYVVRIKRRASSGNFTAPRLFCAATAAAFFSSSRYC